MKNDTKSTITNTILAIAVLVSYSITKDAQSQVNSILCHKSGATKIKKGKITVYNSPECYIKGDNVLFFAEISKIKKNGKFDKIVVYPFYSKSSWNDGIIIKIDGSQDNTWRSDWYFYDKKTGTLENTNSIDLDGAIAKIDGKVIK